MNRDILYKAKTIRGNDMKQYDCPDCTHIEDTCENCSRYKMYHRTNIAEENTTWPYYETLISTNIPPACRNCPNHPSNGGSGDCNCILGGYDFTCNTEV